MKRRLRPSLATALREISDRMDGIGFNAMKVDLCVADTRAGAILAVEECRLALREFPDASAKELLRYLEAWANYQSGSRA